MPITDYNKKKPLEVSSTNDSGTTQDKAQPILVTGGDDSTTGTGDIVIDFTNITDAQDIAVYDQNGNLLDYEIEDLDTTSETGVLWAYDSWTRDDSVQAQIAYGDNSQNVDRQNVTGTWNNTGQDTEVVQHLNANATDSTSNNNDGTISGPTSIGNGEFDGAYSFDGIDDNIKSINLSNMDTDKTVVAWAKSNDWNNGDQEDFITTNDPGFSPTRIQSRSSNEFAFVVGNGSDTVTRLKVSESNFKSDEWVLLVGRVTDNSQTQLDVYSKSTGKVSNSTSINFSVSSGNELSLGARPDESFPLAGDVDEVRVYTGAGSDKSDDWVQADYDASPNAGQVYFSQRAAEATVTDQTVTIPVTTTSSTNPDPQVNATVDVSIPTSTATTVNPAPTVSPGAKLSQGYLT